MPRTKLIGTTKRNYHYVHSETLYQGPFNGPKRHHIILTVEDSEENIYGMLYQQIMRKLIKMK